MADTSTTTRNPGIDLGRTWAVLLLTLPFLVSLRVIPVGRAPWIFSVMPDASTLFVALLGIAAYLYAQKTAFPQFFAGTITRFIGLYLFGWVWAMFLVSAPFIRSGGGLLVPTLLITCSVVTLTTVLFVYLPLWAQVAYTVLICPHLPFMGEAVSRAAAQGDIFIHRYLSLVVPADAQPLLGNVLDYAWIASAGVVLWRLYEDMGAKLAVPVVLFALAYSAYAWFTPAAVKWTRTLPWLTTVVIIAASIYACAELARLLAGNALLNTALIPGQMSLSVSAVLLLILGAGAYPVYQMILPYLSGTSTWAVYGYAVFFSVIMVALVLGIAVLLRKLTGRGPCETFLALISGRG